MIDIIGNTYISLIDLYSIEKNRTTKKWIDKMELLAKECINTCKKEGVDIEKLDEKRKIQYKYILQFINV